MLRIPTDHVTAELQLGSDNTKNGCQNAENRSVALSIAPVYGICEANKLMSFSVLSPAMALGEKSSRWVTDRVIVRQMVNIDELRSHI